MSTVASSLRLAMLSIVSLMIIGCGHHYKVYEIDGATEKFCVPESQVVEDVSWVPPDHPGTPNTFAFQGCGTSDEESQDACMFPAVVRGGVVSSLATFRARWQDFAADTFYKQVASEPDSTLEILDEGSMLVVSNTRLWEDWFIWRIATPFSNEDKPQLSTDDELLAVCRFVKDLMLRDKQKKRVTVACDRSIRGKDYAIRYSFESNERIPLTPVMLDAQMVAEIDRWRCQK